MAKDLPKKFDEFSERVDRGWRCITTGLNAEEVGFNVTKNGVYVGNQTDSMRQNGDQFGSQFDRNQKGNGPTIPYPRPQRRDDLDMEKQYSPLVKPGF